MGKDAENVLRISNLEFFQVVEDYLTEIRSVKIRIKGSSMLPFLKNGDQVDLESINFQKFGIGEIVLARWKEGYVLHRIVLIGKQYIYLAGDNNLFQIEKVKPDSIIAKVGGANRDDASMPVTGIRSRILGMSWFLLRPARWLVYKMNKITKK